MTVNNNNATDSKARWEASIAGITAAITAAIAADITMHVAKYKPDNPRWKADVAASIANIAAMLAANITEDITDETIETSIAANKAAQAKWKASFAAVAGGPDNL